MQFQATQARLRLALQIISHPSNSLAAFIRSETNRLVALAEKHHEEVVTKEGKNTVPGSSSASTRPATREATSQKQPQKQQYYRARTKTRAGRLIRK